MRKEEMEQQKELHLEATRKQASATENMAKTLVVILRYMVTPLGR